MGYAVAAGAAARGARVDLVSAPTGLPVPPGVIRHDVTTAVEMREVVVGLLGDAATAPAGTGDVASAVVDVVIKAAAVADYRPDEVAQSKLKKDQGPPTIRLVANPDILAELGQRRREPSGAVQQAGPVLRDPVQQGLGCLLDQPGDGIEPAFQIGIGHILAPARPERQEQRGRRIASAAGPGPQRLDIGKVLPIHREDQIERPEIRRIDLPGPKRRQIVARPPRGLAHPRIGRLAQMPGAGACAVRRQRQPAPPGEGGRDRLGRGRAADVAEADEEQARHGISFPELSMRRRLGERRG